MDIVSKVREHVEDKYKNQEKNMVMDPYGTHVKYVVEYAVQLAKKLKADQEIVEIAALLHDIARLEGSNENHHIDSADYAEKLLTEFEYEKEKIEHVKDCIISHRGRGDIPRKTIEAECIASADAMAHYRDIPSMFYLVYVGFKKDPDEGRRWLKEKYERSFKKMIPEAQEIVRGKYEAVIKILD